MVRIITRIANGIVHISTWLTTFLLLIFWKKIPAEIPTHYNWRGEADDWGNKGSLIMLVIFVFFIYGMHLICMKAVHHLTTPEKMYSRKLAPFVNADDLAYGEELTRAYLAWTDATILVLFAYLIFTSAFSVSQGAFLIWAVFGSILVELGLYLFFSGKRKRLIRLRIQETAARDDAEEPTKGDADGGYAEPTEGDVFGGYAEHSWGDTEISPEEKTVGDIDGVYEKEKVDDM